MIETFEIKADVKRNQLEITLNGYFQMSEVNLALDLATQEILKLKSDYDVILNVKRFKAAYQLDNYLLLKLHKMLELLGAGKIKTTEANITTPGLS